MNNITRKQSIELAIELFGIFLIVLAIISFSQFLSNVTYFLFAPEYISDSTAGNGPLGQIISTVDFEEMIRKNTLLELISTGIFTVIYLLGGGYFLRGANIVQNLLLSNKAGEEKDQNEDNKTEGRSKREEPK